ncbi:Crp/Fnr family transcriptional regulator [Desulfonatronovibrio hydrogenovorans]|uniref:Crp/Fnr family transcriptional regulator n=1 Tax=Desulfonatronovibrio hydrogenovorans TaxID=53245 RepID=UPI00048F2AAC|nr:Crp/Fnr family transcriptional regulator [Desulfonatronovibrio hydrogenovorans]
MNTKLMGINLLKALERPELAALRSEFRTRSYGRGSVIFEPNSPANQVFIMATGTARLYLACQEKEFTLSILSPGDIYSTHTRAYIQALEDVSILSMPTEGFAAFVQDHPELMRTMIPVLGDILQSCFSIIHSLVFKGIPCRVAEFFLAAAGEYGRKTPQGCMITFSLTTEQIAKIVGSTRQTVSEALTRLENLGLVIRQGRGAYLLPDLKGLEDFAATGME